MELNEVLKELQHEQHLVRSRGQTKLKKLLAEQGSAIDGLLEGVLSMLDNASAVSLLGGYLSAAILVPYYNEESEFVAKLLQTCIRDLESPESRVRYAVGDCLGELAKKHGTRIYLSVSDIIRQSIRTNFDRDESDVEPTAGDDPLECLLQTTYRVVEPGKGEMRHGTEGWKSLETSYRSLLKIVEGTGNEFSSFVDSDLWDMVFRGTQHPNRFVREISYFTIGAVIDTVSSNSIGSVEECVKIVAKGLGDDWSQVRYAASVAARKLMMTQSTKPDSTVDVHYHQILPQMCLNRYYVADGVRLYSQESWKLVVGTRGREWVALYIDAFVDYYVRQCAANNHAVREAACSCIAELLIKIDKEAVSEYVPRLFQSLVICFKDASWPVRDAACCACGKGVRAFPDQAKVAVDELYTLWLAHLADNIPSVREDSAVALVDAIHAYGDEAVDRILPEIRSMILEARKQKKDSEQFAALTNVTQFGVAQPKREDDPAHTDQTMFSCGSLAPKLARGGGCMDHGFKREKEPWEVSDGAIYFVREFSSVRPLSCHEFLPALAELACLQDFQHVHTLRRSIWKALPTIAENIGKRPFKQFLAEFLQPLFRSLRSSNQLEQTAATEAVISLGQYIGEGIFRGRLSEDQEKLYTSIKTPQHAM